TSCRNGRLDAFIRRLGRDRWRGSVLCEGRIPRSWTRHLPEEPARVLRDFDMRVVAGLVALAGIAGCTDLRGAADRRCGTFSERCPAPPDSALVNAIAAAWVIELDPQVPTRGPLVVGRGGDSAWTVAVYEKLRQMRPQFFVLPVDTAHALHLTGISVEMLGDTARVTTSVSQCTTRET